MKLCTPLLNVQRLWNAIPVFVRRHWAGVTGLLIIFGALTLWQIPKLEVAPLRKSYQEIAVFEEEDRARSTLAQMMGGAILLAGLWFTWRRIEISWQGQVTERFTRAVEQLGSTNISIRVGATYALERIARESERDRWSIVDLLAAFIRDSRPIDETIGPQVDLVPKIPRDVQSALVVIGRLVQINDVLSERRYLDLEDTDLRGADLSRLSFPGVRFTGAWLDSASLRETNLERANFLHAKLKMADLTGANLHLADFEATNAQDADFSEATSDGANLKDTQCQGADFHDASIDGVMLAGTHFEGADLRNTRGVPHMFPILLTRVFVDERTQLPGNIYEWMQLKP